MTDNDGRKCRTGLQFKAKMTEMHICLKFAGIKDQLATGLHPRFSRLPLRSAIKFPAGNDSPHTTRGLNMRIGEQSRFLPARHAIPFCSTVVALLIALPPAGAQSPLGSAQAFGVLGAAGVSNVGPTTIEGDLGVSPSGAITTTGGLTVSGSVHENDTVAQQAQLDALTAYNELAARPTTTSLTGQDLGSFGTLTPGVYFFASSAQLTGNLLLDFLGNPSGAFVFHVVSDLTTASGSSVTVANGGAESGIYWLVGSSATLGEATTFAGNIIANTSITLITDATIECGRAIALNGAVTLGQNVISNDCSNGDGSGTSDYGSYGFSGGGPVAVSTTPEPASVVLIGSGLLGAFGLGRRKRTA